jgi:hypothetical protein
VRISSVRGIAGGTIRSRTYCGIEVGSSVGPLQASMSNNPPLISVLAHATPAILFAKLDYAIGDAQERFIAK